MTCMVGRLHPRSGLRHSQYPRHYTALKVQNLSGNFRYSVTATPPDIMMKAKPGYILANTIAMRQIHLSGNDERLHPV